MLQVVDHVRNTRVKGIQNLQTLSLLFIVCLKFQLICGSKQQEIMYLLLCSHVIGRLLETSQITLYRRISSEIRIICSKVVTFSLSLYASGPTALLFVFAKQHFFCLCLFGIELPKKGGEVYAPLFSFSLPGVKHQPFLSRIQ